MHNTQQLRLMQLASSALPVGSFTWSQGLEWAVEIGWVKSVDDFSDWQIQQMEQNFYRRPTAAGEAVSRLRAGRSHRSAPLDRLPVGLPGNPRTAG